jgi:Zn-dependent protease
MKCEYCGAEESLPFVCNYCGGVFCGDHRLPEAHNCKGDINVKRVVQPPPQAPQEPAPGYYSTSSEPFGAAPRPHPPGKAFSRVEIRDIIVAWVALGFAFGIAYLGGASSIPNLISVAAVDPGLVATFFLAMFATVGAGFVLHELSHKFVAERRGFWAEFRVWPLTLGLAVVSSLFGFLLAAPGATYIAGTNISERDNGIISLAGPALNVVIALLFLPLLLTGITTTSTSTGPAFAVWFPFGFLGYEGVFVNVWLAMFNLLPFWILDGSKVFRWNKLVWAAFFIPLLVVSAIFFLVVPPPLWRFS